MATSPSAIVAAIDAAILVMLEEGGAQTVSFDGKTMTYASLTELREARNYYAQLADSNDPGTVRISSIKYGGTP